MSASSPTARSVGLTVGSALAVAAVLFATYTALDGRSGTTDSKAPRPRSAPTAPAVPPSGTSPAASAGPASAEPACNLFDAECQEEHPSEPTVRGDEGTGPSAAATHVPDPPQGTAATGGGYGGE
ncbi:hypothetical protein AB0910_00265 [Streptomyces sp. NPDC047002]|uniref:hypothetical protein n=1 Tax=Streptomyces sp. NPDC047002 TaxID=3155475 RepID=UPI0034516EA4